MPEFTPGKWWIAPPIFDGDVIYAPPTEKGRRNDVVAMGILNKADARLIATAPELYELLKEELIPTSDYGGTLSFAREAKIRKVIDYIDGKEGD
ncbi:MAG: hypothetical protein IJG36_05215 [Synergistaceae bacterium]|nr:hypothetical protein [Synergistaceae bacterium]